MFKSDIIHQSIYELIHSEDREEFKRQLSWNLKLPAERSDLSLNELLTKRGNFRKKTIEIKILCFVIKFRICKIFRKKFYCSI
jgi:hypothetical protein